MSERRNYVAITIGPISTTMQMSTSPAALWASSYLFSWLAGRLRKHLMENGVDRETFITPYVFPENEQLLQRSDGVGLLHDHIIFEKPVGFTMEKLRCIREQVLEETNDAFGIKDFGYLYQYIRIAAVEYSAENPILESSAMLDNMELAAFFVKEEKRNPILDLFTSQQESEGKESSRNAAIKKRAVNTLGISEEEWQLLTNKGRIRDLANIASGGRDVKEQKQMKKFDYYAVVRADGDNMSSLIASLKNKEAFHEFSDTCLRYCSEVAEKVKDYGGMTVYAGGDDLLALLPCQGAQDRTLADFVNEINDFFRKLFKDLSDQVSLTWGITICHCKYPLYEALQDSANLLFDAKSRKYKNAVSLRLIKHSGQTSAVCIPNMLLERDDLGSIRHLQKRLAGTEAGDEIMLSALHKLRAFEVFFRQADVESAKHMFVNMFDADAHTGNGFLHDELPELYSRNCLLDGQDVVLSALDKDGKKILRPGEEGKGTDPVAALHALLRIMRFYVEKAGDRE